MKVLVLMGSPRLQGNTAELCKPFMEELKDNGADVRYVTLADKNIAPCKGCYACQEVSGEYGCASTPILLMWGCTLCRTRTIWHPSGQRKLSQERKHLQERCWSDGSQKL